MSNDLLEKKTTSIKIRRCSQGDFAWILGQLKEFSQSIGTIKHSLMGDEAIIMEYIKTMHSDHLILVAHKGDMLMGFIAGMLQPHPFNPKIRSLLEIIWWVATECRQSRAGLMLLDAFTEYGLNNADWVQMSLEHNSPIKDETMIKRGYRLQDRAFVLEV